MALFTKSIQFKKEKKDGIRICIMRRPGDFEDFDIWMPVLAPSHKLLNDSHSKKINWLQYKNRFKKEVILNKREYLNVLIDIALKKDVTILCWEKTPVKCHRRLVAEACQKINPQLNTLIK
ncbi:hypothetical protein COT75_04770 [Candidatus Beckwithbacteria bacterium CG10_big_fil_rev_8_21_14_0_10_34_10]|uniref:DUF488 domain-containing protein n=1 Tax=Candidatus Beckwithbacteria bacterium CG10_big_fil_rev_8_21_14_0_10_34_10 TaxID=1974495 RepID=A0A2H0W808_9BACT|nr:MAG: hypothetical protein COT75_04770 [Candidatus Beckwithbacteria bacterium CG10_big_fil_rev_8_21_14_0_10_34_10]